MKPANNEVVEGCLVMVVGFQKRSANLGKIGTAIRKVFDGEIAQLGGLEVQFTSKGYRYDWGWLVEGDTMRGHLNTEKPYNSKGWAIFQPTDLIPIYPEEDDKYLEELLKESNKCEA